MGNKLFQEARKAVSIAADTNQAEKETAIRHAENSLSSAYANSTIAEKEQLRRLQGELDSIKS
ncbi:DUF3813 domain-containing protein [Mesobacillus zeae]|uniref:DUF3813 domain-containing protein n=1 Tax=Mesobacillus zeae TaxID=1917180 RepID=A0A398B3Z5_9BACI|nr:DUF3813 domain-containing protein [Mesobacillus zeae]RID84567.1 DUF3813 domain-containing protein [Mesobacillus zeae]